MNNNSTFGEKIKNFFTQTLRRNWLTMLLSLAGAVLLVLCVSYATALVL